MTAAMPTYEQLIGADGAPVRGGLVRALKAMEPGDILLASSVSRASSRAGISGSVSTYADRIGRHGEYALRTFDGVLYVVRLRPEHKTNGTADA